MSVSSHEAERPERDSPTDAVAGLLAASALFASLIAVAYRPARIAPVAIGVALLATVMTSRHRRLTTAAVAIAALSFWAGMAVAVLTENPIF